MKNFKKNYLINRITNVRYSADSLSGLTKKDNLNILEDFLSLTECIVEHFGIPEQSKDYIQKHIVSMKTLDWASTSFFIKVKSYYDHLEINDFFELDLPLRSIEVIINQSNDNLYDTLDSELYFRIDLLISKIHTSIATKLTP
ncbi:Uncharacterised protein [Chryseobacterium nakagawai]|uniref:Uncharacterized protein n=1 Tax=Chryseobacterium nakagawai TaxID=1241982 RepID=A0AAD1DPH8_CHRNA|nr:hypothetical protein [Chryseobacterium nakagawai]AZA89778.1 hypothetical protein EG343_03605 [Chryseobacterium nakagawai]VEH21170.1 Uncharacterised protein [Chryseobacterium nakagawai]